MTPVFRRFPIHLSLSQSINGNDAIITAVNQPRSHVVTCIHGGAYGEDNGEVMSHESIMNHERSNESQSWTWSHAKSERWRSRSHGVSRSVPGCRSCRIRMSHMDTIPRFREWSVAPDLS